MNSKIQRIKVGMMFDWIEHNESSRLILNIIDSVILEGYELVNWIANVEIMENVGVRS